MSKFGKSAIGKLVRARDRNTRGLAKVTSAIVYLGEIGALLPPQLDKACVALMAERRLLNAALEVELKKQKPAAAPAEQREAGWNG